MKTENYLLAPLLIMAFDCRYFMLVNFREAKRGRGCEVAASLGVTCCGL